MIVVEPVGSILEVELLTGDERNADDADGDEGVSPAFELASALEGGSPADEAGGDDVDNPEVLALEDVVGGGADKDDPPGTVPLFRGGEVGPTTVVVGADTLAVSADGNEAAPGENELGDAQEPVVNGGPAQVVGIPLPCS